MTTAELIEQIGSSPLLLLAIFVGLPVLTWLTRFGHAKGQGGQRPWRYLYAVWVYAACLPGTLATVLVAYALFISGDSLLQVDVLVYGLPIVSMLVTLVLMRRNVAFNEVPGFDRLSGLMVMLAMTFVLVLAIQKTSIWLFFGGSIATFILLVGGIFALLKWGAYTFFRSRDEAKAPAPKFPLP